MEQTNQVMVGIGVMVMKGKKVLLGKRKYSHGAGFYSWPGGKMEYMESFEDCAKREVFEETGLEIENVRFVRLMNLKDYYPKHFVDIALAADWKKGEPKAMEPEKYEDWRWYEMNNLPKPLFAPCKVTVESLKTKQIFFDN